ncbi:MAG: PTS sugar transporter subunit IIA [Planctomycetota bacterium]
MTELAGYLTSDRVAILAGLTKAQAIEELVAVTAASGGIDAETLAREIWKREELMSTGIGNGLAIPHVRMAGISSATMAVGVSAAGISDYESLDKQPVRIVVLIAAGQGEHETYIRLLAKVADVLKEEELRQAVLDSDDPQTIHRILTEGKA